MLSAIVFLSFFALFGAMLLGRKDMAFVYVFLGMLLFPPCVYFMQKPQLSPQQLFLYTFFAINLLKNGSALADAVFKHPLRIPLFLSFVSLVMTVVLNGEGGKGIYNAFRYFMENYAYLIIAYMGGLACKDIRFEEKWNYPILVFCVLGIMEFVLKSNFIFPLICKAFPYYDGFYDLNGVVSASRTYRSRIFITTTHPTVLGSVLCCSLMMLTCRLKSLTWKKNMKIIVWSALFLLVCMSGSRTALVCTLIGLFIYGFLKSGIHVRLLAIVAIAFSVMLLAPQVIQKFSVEGEGSSLSLREQQLLFSYMHFMKSPIYGNGVRYTSKYVMERDTYNDRVVDSEIGGLESVVFFKLIDYGLIGIACYILLFLVAFYYFFRRRRFEYGMAGLLITVSFFVFACLSGEIGGNNTFAYMLMGFCMGAVRKEEEIEDDEYKIIADAEKVENEVMDA